jgi:hypothetical protein
MKITFKNNNVYYYHYKVFRGELNWVLVPVTFILIFFFKDYIKYVSLIFLLIGIVGIIDSYYKSKKEKLVGIFIGGTIMHLVGFYPLLNVKKYFEYNNIIYSLWLEALVITYFLPYWPYAVSRTFVLKIIMLLYIIYTIYHIYNHIFAKKIDILSYEMNKY